MPTNQMSARYGLAPLISFASINFLMIGVRTTPPMESPEDAAAIPDARFVWNQRVTTVVAVVKPLHDHATANTP